MCDKIEIVKGEWTHTFTETHANGKSTTAYFDPGVAQESLLKRGYVLVREGVNASGRPVQVWERKPKGLHNAAE